MSIDAGTVEVGVVADADRFDKDLRSKVDRTLNKVERTAGASGKRAGSRFGGAVSGAASSGLARLGAAAAGAFAGAAIVRGIGSVVSAASDLGEQQSKVATVFGKSAGVVEAYASRSAQALGVSRVQALTAAGTFGNLFTAIGLTADKSAVMSTKLVGLAADLASFNNASPEETLLALQSGLNGEAEPLRRFGVLLDDATIKQKAFALGLSKSAKADITPAVKAQAAYAVILEQTKVAQGDVARTSGGLANTQRRLAAKTDDLKSRLGQGLLPAALSVAGGFEKILDGESRISPALDRIKGGAEDLFRGLKGGEDGLGASASSLQRFGATVRDDVIPAVTDAAQVVGPVLAGAFGLLDDVLGPVASAVGALAGVVADHTDAATALAGGVAAGVVAYKAFVVVSKAVIAVRKVAGVLRAIAAGQVALNVALAANPIGLVVAALVGLGVGLVIAYRKSETFREIVNGAFRAVAKVALGAIDKILAVFGGLFRVLGKLPGGAGKAFREAGEAVDRTRAKIDAAGAAVDAFGRKKVNISLGLNLGPLEQDAIAAEKRIARIQREARGGRRSSDTLPPPKKRKPDRRLAAAAAGAIIRRPTVVLVGEAGPEEIRPIDAGNTPGNAPLGRGGAAVVQHFHVSRETPPEALMRAAAFRFRQAAG